MRIIDPEELWRLYQSNKQTVEELSAHYQVSTSTIKRTLRLVKREWRQPVLTGMEGFVHLDGSYWGRSSGILLAIDDTTGMPLYLEFITSETNAHYENAVLIMEQRGFLIKGLILDGRRGLSPPWDVTRYRCASSTCAR